MTVEVDIRKLDLKPGDKLWIETDRTLSREQAENISSAVKEWAGMAADDVLLVLHGGMSLRILSREE